MKTLTILAAIAYAFASMNTISIEKLDAPKSQTRIAGTVFHNAQTQIDALDAEGY